MVTSRAKNDGLDRALDTALAKYSAVEPRVGLEDRILANLRTAAPPRRPPWWRWGLAAATLAVVLIGIALSLHIQKPAPPRIATHVPATTPAPHDSTIALGHRNANPAPPRTRHLRPRETAAANPKLETFPSPQPLSEQEKILAAYVSQFHDEAVLIARVRTEASKQELEQELQEMNNRNREDTQAR